MARILIVDDVESDRVVQVAILTKAGHEVLSASDGEPALRQHLERGVDLVITDLQMPDVHGFELIAMLRDLSPSPPVIAVSGTGEFQLDMARQLGAAASVSKPIDAVTLLQAVQEVLGE